MILGVKRIGVFLLAILCLLPLYSCNNTNDIDLSLRLSMRVLKKSYECTGYWEYDKTVFPNGHWILYDSGAALHGDEVYAVEKLELGETRITAPFGYYGQNLNLNVDFDGYIQVQTEDPEDKTIYLSHSLGNIGNPQYGSWEAVSYTHLVRHEFVSENGRVQRTTFANGVRITVDFDAKTYSVEG